jgi:uncharacterized membrane protein
MGQITVTTTIEAPVEAVFAYVDDHRNTTRYMKDLTRWKPVGSQTHGKGSRFAVTMQAGPKALESELLITEWTENRAIGWVSEHGFKQSGRWSFKRARQGTEATYHMDYEFGLGIAGRLLAKVAEPFVRMNIEQSVANLKEQTEPRAASAARSR